MLIIGRRPTQTLLIGDTKLTLLGFQKGFVRLGIESPQNNLVLRGELVGNDEQQEQYLETCRKDYRELNRIKEHAKELGVSLEEFADLALTIDQEMVKQLT